jgi:hypothetical protein
MERREEPVEPNSAVDVTEVIELADLDAGEGGASAQGGKRVDKSTPLIANAKAVDTSSTDL